MYRFEELHPHLDSGDLVLFSDNGAVSTGIRWLTRSAWSHVGLVVRLTTGQDRPLCWESTVANDTADLDTGRIRAGVQLTPLDQRIAACEGRVAVRRLEVERTPAMISALHRLRQELRGRPFEKSHVQLFRAAYDGPFGDNPDDLSSLFCSELVAEAYQRMGLLPPRPRSSEYTPADFATAARLTLLQGRLGPELSIRRSD